jgi:hypothetical protein
LWWLLAWVLAHSSSSLLFCYLRFYQRLLLLLRAQFRARTVLARTAEWQGDEAFGTVVCTHQPHHHATSHPGSKPQPAHLLAIEYDQSKSKSINLSKAPDKDYIY